MYSIQIQFGSRTIRYMVRHRDTLRFLEPYWTESRENTDALSAPTEEDPAYQSLVPNSASPAYREYKLLLFITARELLYSRACIFHGAAFLWNGLAWLVTAPSGTGKTTHYRWWKELYGHEIKLICGDMPVLEFRKESEIWVFPTPWNGKERYGSPEYSGKLGGIVLLEQGKEDSISLMEPGNAVKPLFLEFASLPETSEEIRTVTDMEREMLNSVPVWKLINTGGPESAKLTRDSFWSYLEKKKDEK